MYRHHEPTGDGAGYRVVISTGDKDMAQLVNPAVTLINTMNNQVLDERSRCGRQV